MRYQIKRTVQMSFTFIFVVHLTFFLMRALPGGPADYLRAQLLSQGLADSEMSISQINQIVENHANIRPDQSLFDQYVTYMSSLIRGDLGTSIWFRESVTSIYAEALPWTLFVMGSSIILIYLIGILMGSMMAYKDGSRFDSTASIVSIIANSIPFYILAIFLIFVFAIQLEILPLRGRYPPGVDIGFSLAFIAGAIKHAILPVLSMTISITGGVAITMRGNAIQVLGKDYIRVANLRGLSSSRIATRYVGYNSILPMYTNFMISIGSIFGGAVILEEIFLYRGMGFYIFRGVNSRDFPLVVGGFIIVTATVLLGILIADLTYGFIDPRTQETSQEHY